jgi:DNA-binding MarR family transcriptional regulator
LLYATRLPVVAEDDLAFDHDCAPRDSVDALLASWAESRDDLDFEPVGVISRLARVRGHIDAELEPVFREFGLGPADFEALVTLARISNEHGVSQRRLADELGLAPGTISVRIDRLIDQGLAHRSPDPTSKRNSLIALTGAGRELFERVVPAHLANEKRLLVGLASEERTLLANLLRKLLVEFEGSRSSLDDERIGLALAPAHVTIGMRAAVGLSGVPGLLVRSVEPDTPAARAQLQPGDVLIAAGDRELRSSAALYAALRASKDQCVSLTVLRGNDRHEATLKLDPACGARSQATTACDSKHTAEHIL